MKRTLLLSALFSSLVLAGCQTEGQSAGTQDTASETDTTQQVDSSSDTLADTSAIDSSTAETSDSSESEPVEFAYEVNPDTYAIQPIEEDAESKVALLTFDDAPDGNAVQIAETLDEYNASAIFFVNGMYLESDQGKEDLQTIHEMGFEIGNHTYTHPVLPEISEEQQREEIVGTNDLVEEIIGVRPRFFRAPHGMNTDYTRQLSEEEGMELMNWTYGYDWEAEYQDSEALADIMVNTPYLNDGANLLMHDRTWTRDAVPGIIEGLREQGYTILDSKLIASPEREADTE